MQRNSSLFLNVDAVSLPSFQGPLELLFFLVQKGEFDVCELVIKELIDQYAKKWEETILIDPATDFLWLASTLLLFKSRKLLPSNEPEEIKEQEDLFRTQLIEHLLEYSHFKQVAIQLSEQEERERNLFPRGIHPPLQQKGLGLDEVRLEDLTGLLSDLLKKAKPAANKPVIRGEEWEVAPLIQSLLISLKDEKKIPFFTLFTLEKSRPELVVTFLALLELMKLGKVLILKEAEDLWILLNEGSL